MKLSSRDFGHVYVKWDYLQTSDIHMQIFPPKEPALEPECVLQARAAVTPWASLAGRTSLTEAACRVTLPALLF